MRVFAKKKNVQTKITSTRGYPFHLPNPYFRGTAYAAAPSHAGRVCNLPFAMHCTFSYVYSLIACLFYASYFFSFHTAGCHFSYSLSFQLPKFYVFAQVYVYIIFILFFIFLFVLLFSLFFFFFSFFCISLCAHHTSFRCNWHMQCITLYLYFFVFAHLYVDIFISIFFLLFFMHSFTYLYTFLYA